MPGTVSAVRASGAHLTDSLDDEGQPYSWLFGGFLVGTSCAHERVQNCAPIFTPNFFARGSQVGQLRGLQSARTG